MKKFSILVSILMSLLLFSNVQAEELRIIVFGAHPDDCELKVGGMAAKWAAAGHKVKFVSTTNGDIGNAKMAGGPLARRRAVEVQKAAEILGITSQVLDNHDGELLPTLENRKTVVRLIREWKADIVIGPRPNDYHPDHRYTSILMQDAGYMVTVPFFCPDTPPLLQNPIFLYVSDNFQKPIPFQPDIVISIDNVFKQKFEAIWKFESQIESVWSTGGFENILPIPTDAKANEAYKTQFEKGIQSRNKNIADKFREHLVEIYGEAIGKNITFAEAFELCEYGRRPSIKELKSMFLLD